MLCTGLHWRKWPSCLWNWVFLIPMTVNSSSNAGVAEDLSDGVGRNAKTKCCAPFVNQQNRSWKYQTGWKFAPAVCLSLQGKTFLVSDNCLQHAFSLHHSLCSSLLLAYKGLFDYFTTITKDLPSSHRMELGIFTPAPHTLDPRPVQFILLALDSSILFELTFSIFLLIILVFFADVLLHFF